MPGFGRAFLCAQSWRQSSARELMAIMFPLLMCTVPRSSKTLILLYYGEQGRPVGRFGAATSAASSFPARPRQSPPIFTRKRCRPPAQQYQTRGLTRRFEYSYDPLELVQVTAGDKYTREGRVQP